MILKTITVIVVFVVLKWLWVTISTMGHGTFEGEKTEILRRRNYLTNKLLVSPEEVLNEMPGGIGSQFQGEWAMYSCSMLSAALTNISILYPDEREKSVEQIDRLINIVMSPEVREYDAARWDEDPLESWDSEKSHMSYLSILAWMISGYKTAGGDDKYDDLYYKLCSTLNWRMKESPTLNLQTYPNEAVYVPDMLVTLVALSNFTWQCDDRYLSTVNEWLNKAKKKWTDKETGILKSFLDYNGTELSEPIKGSYTALICYYLTFVDKDFAHEQYELLKKHFMQRSPFAGIQEYYDRKCWLGMDIDSGPIFHSNKYKTVGERKVAVPDAFFKVVLRVGKTSETTKAIGFIYANQTGHHKMNYYVRSVDEVEEASGMDFFYQLDDKTENLIERDCSLSDW